MKLLKTVFIIAAIALASPMFAQEISCDFYHHEGVMYQLAKHKYMIENTMSNVINDKRAKNKDEAINDYAALKVEFDASTTQFVYEMSGKKRLSKTFDRINWAFIKDREKEYCYECKYVFPYDDNDCHYCRYHLHPYQVRWYAQAINDYIAACDKFVAKYGSKKNHLPSRYVDMGISDLLSSVDLNHGIYRMHANRREFLASLLLQLKPETVKNLKENSPYWHTVVYRTPKKKKK
jgi:hypothetical protein